MAAELLVLTWGVIEGFASDKAFSHFSLQLIQVIVPPFVIAGFGAEFSLPLSQWLIAANTNSLFLILHPLFSFLS